MTIEEILTAENLRRMKLAKEDGWENDSYPGYAINHQLRELKPWSKVLEDYAFLKTVAPKL